MNFLFAIALFVISFAVQAITAKKPAGVADAKPNVFEDFNFPTIEEGTPQAVIFGDCWTSDWMVLYTGNLRVEAIRGKTASSGKK